MLTVIMTILYVQVYSQTVSEGLVKDIIYHGWAKDSVKLFHCVEIITNDEIDTSTYKDIFEETENELIVRKRAKTYSSDTYHYFENDKLILSHSDLYGKKINEHPVDEFLEWVGQITEVNHGQMKIYLTNDEKIYNKFSYQNLKKSISLKGTQLHAIQRYGNFYVETVLLYIDGNFHIHSIHRSNDNDAYIRKDNPMYEWMIKNGYDKSYGAYII